MSAQRMRATRATRATIVRPDVGNRRGAGIWAFLLALVTVGALAHVAVRLHGIQIAYALGRERRTNGELEERRRRLNIEIGMLKDPDRIIAIAREKLQMGPPAPEDVVSLGPGEPGRAARPPRERLQAQAPRGGELLPAATLRRGDLGRRSEPRQ